MARAALMSQTIAQRDDSRRRSPPIQVTGNLETPISHNCKASRDVITLCILFEEAIVRTHMVRIGNSRGLRIPKSILQACGIEDAVDLSIADGKLVIEAAPAVRQGWAKAAEEMARNGDDALLDPATSTTFDEVEWEW
jgi:antitoxin MazE